MMREPNHHPEQKPDQGCGDLDGRLFRPRGKEKGAFKAHPAEQRPDRIPLREYRKLSDAIEKHFGSVGEVFVVDGARKYGALA